MNSDKRVSCPICNGAGAYLVKTQTAVDLYDVSPEPCPGCDGSGYVSKVRSDEIRGSIQRTDEDLMARHEKYEHEELPF